MHAVGSYAVIDHSQVSSDGSLISETTALPHSAGLESDYRKTRWVSETMMQRAQQRGLPVSIHRISVLSGDSSSGIADPGEIAWRMARAMIAAAGVPRSTRPLDMLPIDKGVNAMLALAQCPQQQPGINHIIGHRSLEWDEIGDALRQCGHRIDHLQPEEWYRRLRQWSETHADDPVISGLMPLINEGGTDRRYFYKVDGAQTRNRLRRLGIDLDATSPDDLVRTITYLTDTGALPQAISETRTRL
jgi:thioester reductase-like protein